MAKRSINGSCSSVKHFLGERGRPFNFIAAPDYWRVKVDALAAAIAPALIAVCTVPHI